jgi:hypothetical protein
MSNIINDLNKLVNTVQKVDKLLTEKPKKPRIKTAAQKKADIESERLAKQFKDINKLMSSFFKQK